MNGRKKHENVYMMQQYTICTYIYACNAFSTSSPTVYLPRSTASEKACRMVAILKAGLNLQIGMK